MRGDIYRKFYYDFVYIANEERPVRTVIISEIVQWGKIWSNEKQKVPLFRNN